MNRVTLSLSGFQAKHFKPFVDTGWVRIRPITLVFGHNSSGKSALLSILPMLRQTLEDPDIRSPFVFASETGVDLGTYDEVAYANQVSLKTPIWFNIELSEVDVRSRADHRRVRYRPMWRELRELDANLKHVKIEIAANYNKKRRQIAITDFRLSDADDTRLYRTYRKTTAAKMKWHTEPAAFSQLRLAWQHFLPRAYLPPLKTNNELSTN